MRGHHVDILELASGPFVVNIEHVRRIFRGVVRLVDALQCRHDIRSEPSLHALRDLPLQIHHRLVELLAEQLLRPPVGPEAELRINRPPDRVRIKRGIELTDIYLQEVTRTPANDGAFAGNVGRLEKGANGAGFIGPIMWACSARRQSAKPS